MAKQSGLADLLLIGGYDLSGDIGSLQSISASSQVFDVTAINVSAHERILGKLDGSMEFISYFNDAAGQAHARLKTPGGTGSHVCSYLHGSTIGKWGAGLVARQVNYDPTRDPDGMLNIAVQMIGAAYGLDHGVQLTAGKRTDTGATNGASDNNAAGATTKGLSAYLQVTAFTGTDVTMTIQSSSDDGAGDAFANITGGAFAQVTGITSERIVTSLTQSVEQYLRVATTTSGGVTSVTFSVIACRFPVA